ncbi:MAG: XdhC family protein [Candidatus Xenobia bacterium]
MEKREVFQHIDHLSDPRFAVATVVRTRGSTPREAGAKMVIHADGSFFGTIGGGCGEAEVWQEAKRAIRIGQPALVKVDLTESPDAGGEKICGGKMEIFVDLWDQGTRQRLHELLLELEAGQASVVVTRMPGGEKALFHEDGRVEGELDEALRQEALQVLQTQRSRLVGDAFLELLERPPLLIVVGAGHVAQPLVRMARILGFRIAVLDDRAEWAVRERFPEANDVIAGDLETSLGSYPLTAGTYVVLVTRGHKHDETCLRFCLPNPVSYVGMIGSRRRVQAVFRDLEREGWKPEQLDRVYSPIGIDIGAETPEEIAVSILAEIIKIRRGGKVPSMTIR